MRPTQDPGDESDVRRAAAARLQTLRIRVSQADIVVAVETLDVLQGPVAGAEHLVGKDFDERAQAEHEQQRLAGLLQASRNAARARPKPRVRRR